MKKVTLGVLGAGRIGQVHMKNISTFVKTIQIKTVADAILNDKAPEVTDLDGLYPVLMAAAALKSVKENRAVKISEVDE